MIEEDYSYDKIIGSVADLTSKIGDIKINLIVGLSRGGLVPATMLSHYYNIPMESLKWSFRNFKDCGDIKFIEDILYDHAKVLIVDDICDSGESLDKLYKMIENNLTHKQVWHLGKPVDCSDRMKNLYSAVIVNNIGQTRFTPNFYSKEIDKTKDDVWINFPWENWWEKL